MDPLSALLLAGILTTIGIRTAGAAVTDTAAQVKGKTPPSLEKWRTNQQKKQARGDTPQAEPSPWKRRWRNAVEYRNAKAAQKHQARMEWLREHEREGIDVRKRRMQHKVDRWEQVDAKVAELGRSSWEKTKQAAAQAREAHTERKAEKQAWRENTRRSGQPDEATGRDPDSADTAGTAPGSEGGDAAVVPFRRVTVDDAGQHPHRPSDAAELDRFARENPQVDNLASGLADTDSVWDSALYYDLVRDLRDQRPAEHAHEVAEGRRLNGPDDTPIRTEETEISAHRDTTPDNPTSDLERSATVSAPTAGQSGEITDLASALSYVQSASQYCQQITGTFETAHAQASATAQELQAQLGHLETAQSSLAGEGLDSEAARMGQVMEQFTALAQAMQQVETLLSSTQEQLGAAQSELDTSAREFTSQMAIAEQVQSHQSVANSTAFYAHA